MILSLRSLLCIPALVACSHGAATTARAPDDAAAQTAISSEPVTQPPARENPLLTRENADTPPSRPPHNAIPDPPSDDARTTRTETNDDSDPALRQRIRQAAMADGLF